MYRVYYDIEPTSLAKHLSSLKFVNQTFRFGQNDRTKSDVCKLIPISAIDCKIITLLIYPLQSEILKTKGIALVLATFKKTVIFS